MSNATKFFLAAIGLAVVVLFGWWIFSVSNKGQTSMRDSLNQYDDISGKFANTRLLMYDNSTALGSEIIDLINDIDAESTFKVKVTNSANIAEGEGKSTTYSYGNSNFTSYKSKMTDKDETDYYINPSASFKATVGRDTTGAINEVIFVQVN